MTNLDLLVFLCLTLKLEVLDSCLDGKKRKVGRKEAERKSDAS